MEAIPQEAPQNCICTKSHTAAATPSPCMQDLSLQNWTHKINFKSCLSLGSLVHWDLNISCICPDNLFWQNCYILTLGIWKFNSLNNVYLGRVSLTFTKLRADLRCRVTKHCKKMHHGSWSKLFKLPTGSKFPPSKSLKSICKRTVRFKISWPKTNSFFFTPKHFSVSKSTVTHTAFQNTEENPDI